MLDEDTILQIPGYRNCNVGKLCDKNCGQKNQTDVFNFFGHNFCHSTFPPPLHCNHCRTLEFAILSLHQTFLRIYTSQSRDSRRRNIVNLGVLRLRLGEIGWWKSQPKKLKTSVRFFRLQFLSTNHPYTPPTLIAIMSEPSNLRYWVFVKHFWEFTHHGRRTLEDAISWIRRFQDCGIGRGVTKIAAEKIENIGRALKKTFKVWKGQVARPSCQTSSHSA